VEGEVSEPPPSLPRCATPQGGSFTSALAGEGLMRFCPHACPTQRHGVLRMHLETPTQMPHGQGVVANSAALATLPGAAVTFPE
jgi:hypothetical protein